MNTAASTITSDAITRSQILATNFVMFKSISLDVCFTQGNCLLNVIMMNINNNIPTNISLTQSIPGFIRNLQDVISIFMKARSATHKNRYMKFLILGTETSIDSSVGDSFFIIR